VTVEGEIGPERNDLETGFFPINNSSPHYVTLEELDGGYGSENQYVIRLSIG